MKKEGSGAGEGLFRVAKVGLLAAAVAVGGEIGRKTEVERAVAESTRKSRDKENIKEITDEGLTKWEEAAEKTHRHDWFAANLLDRFDVSADRQKAAQDGLKNFLQWHDSNYRFKILLKIADVLSAKDLKEYSDKNSLFKEMVRSQIHFLQYEMREKKEMEKFEPTYIQYNKELFLLKNAEIELLKKCL